MVGYQLRFSRSFNFIKKFISKSELGVLCSANVYNGEFLPDYHKYEDYRKTWMAKKKLGGGIINSQIHELDYCLYLFGRPKYIFAEGGKKSKFKIDVEDHINSLIRFKKNNLAVNINLDFFQKPPDRYIKIVGTKKTLMWDYYNNTVKINNQTANQRRFN